MASVRDRPPLERNEKFQKLIFQPSMEFLVLLEKRRSRLKAAFGKDEKSRDIENW